MNGQQFQRVKAIFAGALDRPAHERADFVRREAADDETIHSEIMRMLAAHETGGGFLEEPPRLDTEILPEGTQLGRWRIVSLVGRGGMGVVYRAEDTKLPRQVALKTLRPVFAADPELRRRLAREAEAAVKINHPAIAMVIDVEEVEGHLVIVSEYVAGETLRAVIGNGLAPARALKIALQIAEGLAAAHDAGVIHRDLKPENVIITTDDRVKIVDFGIAYIEADDATKFTMTGAIIGTPKYMAPEQLDGRGPVTSRTDVYAFGIVLGELFATWDPTTSKSVIRKARIAQIVDVCVTRDPAGRYASGRDLIQVLADPQSPVLAPAPHSDPRWWWEFHQAMAAIVYWVTIWPAWLARQIIGGLVGRALFIATLIAVVIAATLRLHLWFTSRSHPEDLRWARKREGRWIRMADWLFVASLAASGVIIGEERSPVALVLIAIATGAAVAFLAIERATARAAFFTKDTRRSKDTTGT